MFDLHDVFQESTPGVKRDLPVLTSKSSEIWHHVTTSIFRLFKKKKTTHTAVRNSILLIYTELQYYVWNNVGKLKVINMGWGQTLRLYIPHRLYKQRTHPSVASYKQVFNKGTSIPLTCTYLPQNLKCVKKNMFSIRGNRWNLLSLQYVHFNFQPVLTLHAYCWDASDRILSLNLTL